MRIPTSNMTSKENEREGISLGKPWFLDLTVEDDELATEESVLIDEFGSDSCFARRSGGSSRMAVAQAR